jgi:hypothetical protein
VHEKIRDIKCPYCDYAAALDQNESAHIKAVHVKIHDKAFLHCDYAAATSTYLNRRVAAQSGTIFSHVKAVPERNRNNKCPHFNNAGSIPACNTNIFCDPKKSRKIPKQS